MTVAALDLDGSSVDPWSPGYVTPASTPSPRSSRSRSPGDGHGGHGAAGELSLRPACLPHRDAGPKGPKALGRRPVAVSVRDAHHSYVNYSLNRLTGMKAVTHVLNGFSMTVHQGSM